MKYRSTSGMPPPNKAPQYEHAISLIDNTRPPDQDSIPTGDGDKLDSAKNYASLGRKWTKGKLKDELLRRKYSKWQEGNRESDDPPTESNDHDSNSADTSEGRKAKLEPQATSRGRLRDKNPFKKKKVRAKKQEEREVDILYENQRGFHFFGIPLYSSNTLLNFDPSRWQTSAFRDSPVSIINAQLPDPSWAWVSTSWHVDMSYDVDPEGWQYSFSFRQGCSWHGNHPWFHSFVRRRRWLRERIKLHSKGVESSNSHLLTVDYFTIHTKRDRSRGSSSKASSYNRSSYGGDQQADSESDDDDDDDDDEISNILALMKALRRTTVDRKKLGALKSFVEHGNEDLHFLPEYMHEIMAMFIYQTSCRQLLSYLQDVFNLTTEYRAQLAQQNNPENETEKRRLDILLQAVSAANDHVKDLEYSSDVRSVSRNADQDEARQSQSSSDNEPGVRMDDGHSSYEENVIKGIPDKADIGNEPRIRWAHEEDDIDTDVKRQSDGKGKGKVELS